ncbi:hypothetical protein NC653_003943 [Populus alba x Populus x berolinensis]|uniref:Uncharacterized protein n=1 Tax=Populus alba x Populus x berolinensis TaxID=444605 RepID=A0AAD6RST8_9ROSI|nr:hypothetical protein NC653_003943 [Populus alba x Populus x berolinensis]
MVSYEEINSLLEEKERTDVNCEWALEITYEKDPTKFCFNGRFSQEVMMENDGDIGRPEFLHSQDSSTDHTRSTLDFTISEFIVYLELKFR